MADSKSSWSFVGISAEARQAAEEAANAADMELDAWLAQLIKYTSAMELSGRGVSLDDVIRQSRAANAAAEEDDDDQPEQTFPGIDRMASPEERERGFALGPFGSAEQIPVGQDERHEESRTGPGEIDIPPYPGRPVGLPPERIQPSMLTSLANVREADIEAALDLWRRTNRFEPLLVRPRPNFPNEFEVVSGIERWHAARRAHASEIPVLIQEMDDGEALIRGLVARLKGRPVSALTEATIYLQLMTEASQSTEQVAALVGKPAAHIAAMVRILNLPQSVRIMLERGEITVLHARALLDAHNPEAIARQVIAQRLDIYQTEQLVRGSRQGADLVGSDELLDPTDFDADDAFAADDAADQTVSDTSDAGSAVPPAAMAEPGPRLELSAAGGGATTIPFPDRSRERAPSNGGMGHDGATTRLLERQLSQLLGTKVMISERDNVGILALHYADRDQLGQLIARLNRSADD